MSLTAMAVVALVGPGSSDSAAPSRQQAPAPVSPTSGAVSPVDRAPRPEINRGQDIYDPLPGAVPFQDFLLGRRLIHRALEPRSIHETGVLLPNQPGGHTATNRLTYNQPLNQTDPSMNNTCDMYQRSMDMIRSAHEPAATKAPANPLPPLPPVSVDPTLTGTILDVLA